MFFFKDYQEKAVCLCLFLGHQFLLKNLKGKNYQEIAHEVIRPFVQNDIYDDDFAFNS